jgi:hypothetical protein
VFKSLVIISYLFTSTTVLAESRQDILAKVNSIPKQCLEISSPTIEGINFDNLQKILDLKKESARLFAQFNTNEHFGGELVSEITKAAKKAYASCDAAENLFWTLD